MPAFFLCVELGFMRIKLSAVLQNIWVLPGEWKWKWRTSNRNVYGGQILNSCLAVWLGSIQVEGCWVFVMVERQGSGFSSVGAKFGVAVLVMTASFSAWDGGVFCFFPLLPYVLTKIDAGALCKASCQRDSKDVWKKFEERWRNSTFENSGIYILWLYIVGYINWNVDVFGDGVDVQPTRSTRSSYKLTRKRESWPRFIPVANSAVTGVQSKNGWDLRRVSYFLIWTFFFIHLCYLFLQVYITSCLHCHVLCELSPCIIIFIFLKKAQKVGLIQDMDTFCPLLAYLVCNI